MSTRALGSVFFSFKGFDMALISVLYSDDIAVFILWPLCSLKKLLASCRVSLKCPLLKFLLCSHTEYDAVLIYNSAWFLLRSSLSDFQVKFRNCLLPYIRGSVASCYHVQQSQQDQCLGNDLT